MHATDLSKQQWSIVVPKRYDPATIPAMTGELYDRHKAVVRSRGLPVYNFVASNGAGPCRHIARLTWGPRFREVSMHTNCSPEETAAALGFALKVFADLRRVPRDMVFTVGEGTLYDRGGRRGVLVSVRLDDGEAAEALAERFESFTHWENELLELTNSITREE